MKEDRRGLNARGYKNSIRTSFERTIKIQGILFFLVLNYTKYLTSLFKKNTILSL